MTEPELLSEYLANGSPGAFEQLVRQNAGMVYAAARRQVGEFDLADDVTQAVFVLLARKAGTIRGPVAGWLISTTYYAAKNARKIAARRRFHERRAGTMKLQEHENPPVVEWECYAPALDEALAQLAKKDRDAIALRYLRGSSLREVGLAAGISEDTARKRVDRALVRLRGILSRRTITPAVAILAAHLTARGSEAAPGSLVNAIVASAGSAAKGSTVASIADKSAAATKAIAPAMAATCAVLFFVAAILIFVFAVDKSSPARPANPISPSFTLAPDQTEARVSGDLQLTRWDAVLNQAGCDAVLRVAHPFATPSRGYEAMLFNGTQLRAAVAAAMDAGNSDFLDSELYTAFETQFGGWFEFDHFNQKLGLFAQSADKESLQRLDNNRIKVTVNLKNVTVILNDRNTQRKANLNIDGEATLAPGDSLAFMCGINAGGGPVHYHLLVYEAYRDGGSRDYASMLYDAAWWCRNGPEGLRRASAIAQVWKASGTHKPFTAWQLWNQTCAAPPPFEAKTSDGQTVALLAICDPETWRYCWWNALGKPVAGDDMWLNYRAQNQSLSGLWAMVQVVGSAEEAKWHMPTGKDAGDLGPDHIFRNVECVKIGDGSAGLDAGVMVGPWIEIGRIKWGETRTFDGIKIQVPPSENRTQEGVYLPLTRTGVLEDQLAVLAVPRKGHEVEAFGEPPRIIITARDSAPKTVRENYQFFDLYDSDVACFRILKRTRQWIHFGGFALRPDPLPPTSVTADELQNAEKILSDRAASDRQAATRATTN